MAAPQKHPADDVAAALARINGMLTMLSGVYDPVSGTFVTGIPFVHESVQAMEVLVTKAIDAISVMYQTCDLTVVRNMPVVKAPVSIQEEVRSPEPAKLSQSAIAFEDAARFAAAAKARTMPQPEPAPEDYEAPLLHALTQAFENHHGARAAKAGAPAPVALAAKAEGYMNAFGPAEQPSQLTDRVEKTLSQVTLAPAPKPVLPDPAVNESRAQSYEDLLRKITSVSQQAHAEGKAASIDGALLPLVETIRNDIAKMRSVA